MYIEIIQATAAAMLLMAHSFLVGLAVITGFSRVSELSPFPVNRYLALFFCATIGLVVNIMALFAIGIAGLLSPVPITIAAVFLAGVAGWSANHRSASIAPVLSGWRCSDWLLLAALLAAVVIASVHAPGHWDDTMYHLPLARYYLEQQAIVLNEYIRFPLFPQNGNLLVTLGLMLGDDLGAQVFATLPLFLICVGLLGASLWQTGSMVIGLLSIYFLYRLGPVRSTLGYAYIDNTLALFSWGSVLALALSRSAKEIGWILIAGFLAGAAAGTKYFGLVYAGLAGIYLLFAKRNIKVLLFFSLTGMLAGAGWYIRSIVVSGDPLHPAGGNVFGHYLWDALDLKSQASEQATHGVAPASLDIFGALGEVKATVLLLGLLCLVILKAPQGLRPMRFLFASYLAFWFFVTQVDRYLSPVYGVGVFLSAYAIYWLVWRGRVKDFFSGRSPLPGQVATGFLGIVVLGSVLSKPLKDLGLTAREWDKQLNSQPGYNLLSQSNLLTEQFGNRIVQVGFENSIYYFDGVVVGDWYGPGRYRQFFVGEKYGQALLPPERMIDVMRHFDTSMIAVPRKVFSRSDRSGYLQYFDISIEDGYGLVLTRKRQ
ncbi:hypothetical protein [Microbulbifer sp. YPW16]|uniref:hypothetical protein n=1 Tax=Microbulbifer sp. YPW16 TaxID=2904242 RepID=UPI001E2E53B4|nr:hypothetical protein [Microbulbifer sp. YPW16]UHQ56096.1 hypothetical protein LVE68_03690 [Microbulbifer sp. YPW16]